MIAGHGRKIVAEERFYAKGKMLRMADKTAIPTGTIPALLADGWTADQVRMYVIADNRVARNSIFDEEVLGKEIAALSTAGVDLSLLGFGDDIEKWLSNAEESAHLTHEDECPDLPEETPTTQPGDIWILGNHRLICGSSTESATVHAVLSAAGVERADMVFTDPPYLMDFRGSLKGDGSKSANGKHKPIANDKLGKSEGEAFLQAVTANISRYCSGSWYICFYRLGIDWLFDAIKASNIKWRNLIIWQKGQLTLSNSDYKSTYEPIIYGWEDDYLPVMYGWNDDHKFYGPKGEIDNWKLEEGLLSIWEISRTRHNDLHPTMKPVALCERAIRNSSRLHQVVLDLFGGSGSTLIAAEKTGRRACLVELEPAYCDVIVKRWEEYTGRTAEIQKR